MARKRRSEERESKRFGAILFVLLGVLSGLSLWRGHAGRAGILGGAAGLAGALAVFALPLWLRLFRLWMKLALGMSWVMTRVILAVFFFLVMTPFGLLMRLLGKDLLDLEWKDGKSTYWIDKESPEATPERYERQY